tara:strand:- start:6952 stop:7269 length:318 start_codon:yes stop_codon:yes gene_type:complete
MIKTVAISVFFLVTSFLKTSQDQITITLVYEGLDDGVYYFSEDQDFNTYAFKFIDEEASKKYDLSNKKLIGSSFKVTYETAQLMDEENEPYEELTIKDISKIEKK